MATDFQRARSTPLLATSTNTPSTGSHPSVPFPNERYQGSPMKKAQNPYGRDDPYREREKRDAMKAREVQQRERELREREQREEARRREREREAQREAERREAEAKARAEQARAARDKDPDPKKREHTRPPTVIVDREKGTSYHRIGFLGEVSRLPRVVDGGVALPATN